MILVFLMSVRATLVTAVSIPLSLLITFIGLSATGYSLNILTLGALTIAIGRVVDDSIVVIENIKRHLSYGEDEDHRDPDVHPRGRRRHHGVHPDHGGRLPADRLRRRPGR